MKRPWRRRAILGLLFKSPRERRVLPGEQAPGRAEHPGEGDAKLNGPRSVGFGMLPRQGPVLRAVCQRRSRWSCAMSGNAGWGWSGRVVSNFGLV